MHRLTKQGGSRLDARGLYDAKPPRADKPGKDAHTHNKHHVNLPSRPDSSITLRMEHHNSTMERANEFDNTKTFHRNQLPGTSIPTLNLTRYPQPQPLPARRLDSDSKSPEIDTRQDDNANNRSLGYSRSRPSRIADPSGIMKETESRIRPTRILDMKVATIPDNEARHTPTSKDASYSMFQASRPNQDANLPSFGIDRKYSPRAQLEIAPPSPNQSFLSKASSIQKTGAEHSSRLPASNSVTPKNGEHPASKNVSFAEIRQRLHFEQQQAGRHVAKKPAGLRKYSDVAGSNKHDEYDLVKNEHRIGYYTPSSMVQTDIQPASHSLSIQTKDWEVKSNQTSKPSRDNSTKGDKHEVNRTHSENIKVFDNNPFRIGEESGCKIESKQDFYSSENEKTVYQQSSPIPTPLRAGSRPLNANKTYHSDQNPLDSSCLKNEKSTLLELKKFIEKRIKLIDEHEVFGAFQSQAGQHLPKPRTVPLSHVSPPPLTRLGMPTQETNLMVNSTSLIAKLHEQQQASGANTPATVKPNKYKSSSASRQERHRTGKMSPSANSVEGNSRTADSETSHNAAAVSRSRVTTQVREASSRSGNSATPADEEDSHSQHTQLHYLLPSHEEQLAHNARNTLGKAISPVQSFTKDTSGDALASFTIGNLHCEVKSEYSPHEEKKWDESTQLYLRSIKEKCKLLTETINFGGTKHTSGGVSHHRPAPPALNMKRAPSGPYIVLPIHSGVSSAGSEKKIPEWTTPQFTKRSGKPGQDSTDHPDELLVSVDSHSKNSKIQILNDRSPPQQSRAMTDSGLSHTSSTGRELSRLTI